MKENIRTVRHKKMGERKEGNASASFEGMDF